MDLQSTTEMTEEASKGHSTAETAERGDHSQTSSPSAKANQGGRLAATYSLTKGYRRSARRNRRRGFKPRRRGRPRRTVSGGSW